MNNLARLLDEKLIEVLDSLGTFSYAMLSIPLIPHFIPTALRMRRERNEKTFPSFSYEQPKTLTSKVSSIARDTIDAGRDMMEEHKLMNYAGKISGLAFTAMIFSLYYQELATSDQTLSGYLTALSLPIITNICSELHEEGRERRIREIKD